MKTKTLDELVPILGDEHLKQRIDPHPGEPLYLHLSDLLVALKEHATDASCEILDFGAGISPYRSLFPNSRYRRADFPIGPDAKLDFVLDESLKIHAPDGSFDIIISTQVLEHVEDPADYLKECHRLLRPGGKLILTTHGIFADHPCPFDLHRWTADGLGVACKKVGFTIAEVQKLTVNSRALFFLYDMYGRSTYRREASVFAAAFALLHRLHSLVRPSLHRWIDHFFPKSRVVASTEGTNDIYINLLIHAVKPA